MGLVALGLGVIVGTAGTVVGQQGRTGYSGAEVAGELVIPDGALIFDVDAGEGGTFGEQIAPGSFVNVVADGFGPDSKGTIEVTSTRRTLAFVTADGEGVVRHTVRIPDDMELGEHTLHVVGVDADGNPRDVTIGIVIGFGGGGSDWPAWTAGSIAVALGVTAGLYWLLVVRRREDVPAEASPV